VSRIMGGYKVSIGLQNGEMFHVEHNFDLHKCSTWNILYRRDCTYKIGEVVLLVGVIENSRFGKR
jgi:hypothetical protein